MLEMLAFAAPEWFSSALLRLGLENRGVVDYVIWPLVQIALLLFIVATAVAYLV